MAATQIGTTLLLGVGSTLGSYIIAQITNNEANIVSEEVEDENGALATHITYRNEPVIGFELICKSDATPATDFPIGALATLSGYGSYLVENATVTATKSPRRVSVRLRQILD